MKINPEKNLRIWCDGAFSSLRSQGGVGIVIVEDEEVIKKFSYGYKNTTNNKMEIAAVILALRFIQSPCKSITIYSDSQYTIGQLTKGWKRNKNVSLLKEADKQLERVSKLCPDIKFEHVKGHQTDNSIETKYNNMADAFANKASKIDLD